jgi:hypothetical protein
MKLFGIIASILGFIVDAVTILSWFFNPNILTSNVFQIPIINVPLDLESISLIVLIYTFSAFLFLRFSSTYSRRAAKSTYTMVSASTLPFFFIWASTFHNLDNVWVVPLSLFSVNLYVLILLLDDRFSILIGFFLTPLAALWLHEQFKYEWLKSFGLGILVGNSGTLFVLIIVVMGLILYRLSKESVIQVRKIVQGFQEK